MCFEGRIERPCDVPGAVMSMRKKKKKKKNGDQHASTSEFIAVLFFKIT